jgi:hypothetical protein
MDNLINNEWIDGYTSSIIIISNFYNVNMDLMTIFRVLYEDIGAFFHPFPDYGTIDITPTHDVNFNIATIFSIILLINNILFLRTFDRVERYRPKQLQGAKKIIMFCCTFSRYVYYHFRFPNLYEILCKLKTTIILFKILKQSQIFFSHSVACLLNLII